MQLIRNGHSANGIWRYSTPTIEEIKFIFCSEYGEDIYEDISNLELFNKSFYSVIKNDKVIAFYSADKVKVYFQYPDEKYRYPISKW